MPSPSSTGPVRRRPRASIAADARPSLLRAALGRFRAFLVLLTRANLLLALSMAAITRVVQVMAGLPSEPIAPAIVFLAFYAVYSLDRAADASTDAAAHPERASFSGRYAGMMRGSAIAAYALALGLAATRGVASAGVALLPLAAVLAYSFPLVPAPLARRLGFRRLKEVFVVKNVVVAGTLSATAALLPVAVNGGAPRWAPVLAMGGFLFGRWMLNTILFDLRDEAGDRANGLRTVPVVLGRARTLRLLHAANALLAIGVAAAPVLGVAPPLFALLSLSSLYAWAYLRAVAAGGDEHFLCDVVADGELLVVAAVVLPAAALAG